MARAARFRRRVGIFVFPLLRRRKRRKERSRPGQHKTKAYLPCYFLSFLFLFALHFAWSLLGCCFVFRVSFITNFKKQHTIYGFTVFFKTFFVRCPLFVDGGPLPLSLSLSPFFSLFIDTVLSIPVGCRSSHHTRLAGEKKVLSKKKIHTQTKGPVLLSQHTSSHVRI